MVSDVFYSSAKQDWRTPLWLFEHFRDLDKLTQDVAASNDNALCVDYITAEQNALTAPWADRCWCNPPYGRGVVDWVAKAIAEASRKREHPFVCDMLLPARTDTRWFRAAVESEHLHVVCFVSGRIVFGGEGGRFGNTGNTAPFPSLILTFYDGFRDRDFPEIEFLDVPGGRKR